MVFHTLNRGNARADLFRKAGDFEAFERLMLEAMRRSPIRLLAYCLMHNHWHMILWPEHDGQLSEFLRWLSMTHSQRLHAHRHTAGAGHIYQGRFKSFPVQEDEHLLAVLRYVERNALRANLARRAEEWRWCSLWRRVNGVTDGLLSDWPVEVPKDWVRIVNAPQSEPEVEALRRSVVRGTPFGSDAWRQRTARKLGLEFTLRPRGRPREKVV
jgi:putative transposase